MEPDMSTGVIRAAAVQFKVGMDVAENLAALETLLAPLAAGTLAVAPEGALSGYRPEPDFVEAIDREATREAIERVAGLARGKGLHLVVGGCLHEAGLWRNSSFYFGPEGQTARYDKINLAQIERAAFTPGDALPVFDIVVDGTPIRLGIQMCREIRYPEQWRMLAVQGAQVIAYVNNAVGSLHGDGLWRAHMISRAAEVQRFVVGANNAAHDQTCPTMIVAPGGQVVSQVEIGATGTAIAELPLAQVSDWVLSQAREDVVKVAAPITAC
jgi:predicted amidohydrolase